MVQTIGVIGAGQMGAGIAHVCALAGMDVHLSKPLRISDVVTALESLEKLPTPVG